jgi:hypothetical protein
MEAKAGFISADEAADTISTIGKQALDKLTSQGCMEELTICENSRKKLLVVVRDSQEVKYKLRDDATADQHFLFHAAWEISRLMRHQDDADFLARCASFFAGLQTGMYLALAGDTLNNALLKQFNTAKSARFKGGKSRLKWTNDIDRWAREILDGLPNTDKQNEDNAAKIIKTELLRQHEQEIGLTTIKSHLFNC